MTDTTTKTMTAEETRAWLYAYFFGKRSGDKADFTLIYSSDSTWIYEWNLDENVEVIETLNSFDDYYVFTVNFYNDKFSGTPYRTGTLEIGDIC